MFCRYILLMKMRRRHSILKLLCLVIWQMDLSIINEKSTSLSKVFSLYITHFKISFFFKFSNGKIETSDNNILFHNIVYNLLGYVSGRSCYVLFIPILPNSPKCTDFLKQALHLPEVSCFLSSLR